MDAVCKILQGRSEEWWLSVDDIVRECRECVSCSSEHIDEEILKWKELIDTVCYFRNVYFKCLKDHDEIVSKEVSKQVAARDFTEIEMYRAYSQIALPETSSLRSARSGEPATPRSHRPRCAGSAALKHLNSGIYRWVCPAGRPSPMRVPDPEPSSPSLTPFASPPRLFGGHFGNFACAAGGTKCYIGVLGTSCRRVHVPPAPPRARAGSFVPCISGRPPRAGRADRTPRRPGRASVPPAGYPSRRTRRGIGPPRTEECY
eukprot:COSAG02_NODE_439_length_22308_cov_18.013508_18_plen_260_part_00